MVDRSEGAETGTLKTTYNLAHPFQRESHPDWD